MTHKHVKVAVSGDGGDELFGGYRRYRGAPALSTVMRRTPYQRLSVRGPLRILGRRARAIARTATAGATGED